MRGSIGEGTRNPDPPTLGNHKDIVFRNTGPDLLVNSFKPSVLFCGTSANSGKADQTPKNAASDQGFHCLLTEVSFKRGSSTLYGIYIGFCPRT